MSKRIDNRHRHLGKSVLYLVCKTLIFPYVARGMVKISSYPDFFPKEKMGNISHE